MREQGFWERKFLYLAHVTEPKKVQNIEFSFPKKFVPSVSSVPFLHVSSIPISLIGGCFSLLPADVLTSEITEVAHACVTERQCIVLGD